MDERLKLILGIAEEMAYKVMSKAEYTSEIDDCNFLINEIKEYIKGKEA